MNTFNLSRFWQVLKWDFANNFSRMIKTLWIWAAIFVGNFLFSRLFAPHQLGLMNFLGFFFCVFFITLIIGPSLTLKNINKSRQHRLNTLMLPATNGEKFFSLLITTLCTYLLTMIVAFFIADLVQYIVTVAFRFENTGFATTTLLDSNYRISSMMKPFPDIMAQIITLLWIISVYLLGGMFFRRYAWLFVSLGFFILMILFAQFVMHYKSDYIIEIQENTFYIVISIVFGLLTLLNVWLSYRFFCKLQLINRKWINI